MGEMPGYRFYPTEEELVSFYLYNKLEEKDSNISRVIPAVDIYAFEPWQLPEQCGDLCHGDTEQWFFFVPRQEREERGGKRSRMTASGYWKATGSLIYVYSSDGKVIGVKKSMVFYKGKTPSGMKTKWKMNEYRAIKEDLPTSTPTLRNELSLCRIYVVSGSFGAFDRRPTANEASSSQSIIMKNTQESDDKFNASENKNNTATTTTTTTSMEESCSSGCTSFSEENKLSVLWRMQDLGDDEMSVEFIKKNI